MIKAISIATILLAWTARALAADNGFYLGGSIGQANLEVDDLAGLSAADFDGDDTGFKLIAGFLTGFQWTLRYNSRPAPGTTDTDNLYLLTLGYAFDTSRKRT